MAGIYPTPLPSCRASSQPLPANLAQRAFFLLIPGSSARHPEKRWPAKRYGELARLGHVSPARVTQVINLLCLAPDVQEAILFLPQTLRGRDPIALRDLQPIASTLEWKMQRVLWDGLMARRCPSKSQRVGPDDLTRV